MSDKHRLNTARRIEIPEPTAQALATRLEQSEFETIDAYAAFALDLLLREMDDPHTNAHAVDSLEREDSTAESGVENRLESLGYL